MRAGRLDELAAAVAEGHVVLRPLGEEAVDGGHREPARPHPRLAPDLLVGCGELPQREAAHEARRHAGRAQERHEEPRLPDRAALALREGERASEPALGVVATSWVTNANTLRTRSSGLVGRREREALEGVAHLRRPGRELVARAPEDLHHVRGRLGLRAFGQRHDLAAALDAELVEDLVDAIEAPLPDAEADAVAAADREREAVRRAALVEHDLTAAGAGEERRDAALAPVAAHRDAELDLPEPARVRRPHRQAVDADLRREHGEPEGDQQSSRDEGGATHAGGRLAGAARRVERPRSRTGFAIPCGLGPAPRTAPSEDLGCT